MKKLKLNSKLSLNKETVSSLDEDQMRTVQGGLLSIGAHCTHAHTSNCCGSDHTKSLFCGNKTHVDGVGG